MPLRVRRNTRPGKFIPEAAVVLFAVQIRDGCLENALHAPQFFPTAFQIFDKSRGWLATTNEHR